LSKSPGTLEAEGWQEKVMTLVAQEPASSPDMTSSMWSKNICAHIIVIFSINRI
jgi:hypothetical protein